MQVILKKLNNLKKKIKWTASLKLWPRNIQKIRYIQTNLVDLLVFANEDPGREQWLYKEYESRYSEYIQQSIYPSDICLDIGANVGFYSLIMAQVAKNGQVHAFEPNHSCLRLLRANKELCDAENLCIHNKAMSGVSEVLDFSCAQDSAYSTLGSVTKGTVSQIKQIRTYTLDQFIQEQHINKVDVIKLDIEGHEYSVLANSKIIFSSSMYTPRIILIEINNDQKNGIPASPIFELLYGHGYTLSSPLHGEYNFLFTKAK